MQQQIIDSLQDHIAIINTEGIITITNEAWTTFSNNNEGDSRRTGIGINYLQVLRTSNAINEYKGIVAVLQGRRHSYTTPYACLSLMEERWYIMTATVINGENGISGAVICHRNITEYEYARSEVFDVLESMTDAFFALDDNWKFSYLNDEAERLLLIKKEMLIGESLWEKFPEAIGSKFEINYRSTMDQKQTTRFEEFYEPLQSWFEVHAYPRRKGGISVYFKNINEKKAADDRLWEIAHFDQLTKLPNRRYLNQQISGYIEQGTPFSLFFFDLNNFKLINDYYGHHQGDLLLIEVARRMEKTMCPPHFVARLGGDEFVVLATITSPLAIEDFSASLLQLFEAPFLLDNIPPLSLSTSIGVSAYPENGDNPNELLRTADMAMYEAKKKVVPSIVRFESELYQVLKRRLLIEDGLTEHLNGDGVDSTSGIYYVFQPQFDTIDQKIIGIEVLSRWNHMELGYIPPEEFIKVAEDTGLIQSLTEKMIDSVLPNFQIWKRQYDFNGTIAFNMSSSLVSSEAFINYLKHKLAKFPDLKGTIEMEITESLQLSSSPLVIQHMNQLHEIGICLSIDDFGTGYSRLSYFSEIPMKKIKIDKFFIDQIGSNNKGEAVLQSIIILARKTQITVVGEGVETDEQFHYLRTQGCHLVQGFLFDHPMRAEQLELRLKEQAMNDIQ